MTTRVMVVGRQAGLFPGGLPESESGAEYVMAESMADVRAHLAECDVVFQYGQPRDALSANWELTERLRWVHVGGVGIDWVLFPKLVESDVVLTNSRGVFDVSLPEYLLSLMLALAASFIYLTLPVVLLFGFFLATEPMVNRLLTRAELTTTSSVHMGMALEKYTNCTSPLRKYVDFLVHLQIKSVLNGGRADLVGQEVLDWLKEKWGELKGKNIS